MKTLMALALFAQPTFAAMPSLELQAPVAACEVVDAANKRADLQTYLSAFCTGAPCFSNFDCTPGCVCTNGMGCQ